MTSVRSVRFSTKKCSRCEKQVNQFEAVDVLGLTFHPKCFSCGTCSISLTPDSFRQAPDGEFVCPRHFKAFDPPKRAPSKLFGDDEMCCVCNTRVYIMERVNVDLKYVHKNCLCCVTCNNLLPLGSYNLYEGKFYCAVHYDMQIKSKGTKKFGDDQQNEQTKNQAAQQADVAGNDSSSSSSSSSSSAPSSDTAPDSTPVEIQIEEKFSEKKEKIVNESLHSDNEQSPCPPPSIRISSPESVPPFPEILEEPPKASDPVDLISSEIQHLKESSEEPLSSPSNPPVLPPEPSAELLEQFSPPEHAIPPAEPEPLVPQTIEDSVPISSSQVPFDSVLVAEEIVPLSPTKDIPPLDSPEKDSQGSSKKKSTRSSSSSNVQNVGKSSRTSSSSNVHSIKSAGSEAPENASAEPDTPTRKSKRKKGERSSKTKSKTMEPLSPSKSSSASCPSIKRSKSSKEDKEKKSKKDKTKDDSGDKEKLSDKEKAEKEERRKRRKSRRTIDGDEKSSKITKALSTPLSPSSKSRSSSSSKSSSALDSPKSFAPVIVLKKADLPPRVIPLPREIGPSDNPLPLEEDFSDITYSLSWTPIEDFKFSIPAIDASEGSDGSKAVGDPFYSKVEIEKEANKQHKLPVVNVGAVHIDNNLIYVLQYLIASSSRTLVVKSILQDQSVDLGKEFFSHVSKHKDLFELLQQNDDFILIGNSPQKEAALSYCIESDQYVMCLSPNCGNTISTQKLFTKLKKTKIFLCSHVLLQTPFFAKLLEIYNRGDIGYTTSISVNFQRIKDPKRNPDFTELAHELEILFYFLNEITESVPARLVSFGAKSKLNNLTAMIEYKNGVSLALSINFSSIINQQSLTIVGSEGVIEADSFLGSIKVETQQDQANHWDGLERGPTALSLAYQKIMEEILQIIVNKSASFDFPPKEKAFIASLTALSIFDSLMQEGKPINLLSIWSDALDQ